MYSINSLASIWPAPLLGLHNSTPPPRDIHSLERHSSYAPPGLQMRYIVEIARSWIGGRWRVRKQAVWTNGRSGELENTFSLATLLRLW